MQPVFKPFQDDSQSVSLGDITLENQGAQVNWYGSATFTIDQQSLVLAKQLQQVLTEVIGYLEEHDAQAVDQTQLKAEQQQNVSDATNPFL